MAEKTVLVTIRNNTRIPFINRRGPINSPIALPKDVVEKLKGMGFDIKIHDSDKVTVDSETGIRTVVTLENFKAHDPKTDGVLDVKSEPAQPAILPNTETVKVLQEAKVIPNVAQPEECVTELEVDETTETNEENTSVAEEVTTAVESDEEDSEAIELDVYSMEHYNTWTKAQLAAYLRRAESILPEEVVESISRQNKSGLLKIVETYIVEDASEE